MHTRTLRGALTAAATALACTGAAAAPHLNDTGIGFCIDSVGDFIDCHHTGQDATTGRDVKHADDADGRVGFRFTKLCNSGERAGEGSCPAAPQPGDAPDEWGCTRDEVTRLLWETKTPSGHRAGKNTYTFYSIDYDPDGEFGGPNDLTGFVDSVNAAGLCGAHDWRAPSPPELMGIADMGLPAIPAVDPRFFPNTASNFYWAAGTVRGVPFAEQEAWGSDFAFGLGDIGAQFREMPRPVRLVRGGGLGGQRFVISPDQQEVTDRLTGLVWRRCLEGTSFDGERCAGKPLALSWMKTLAHARREARDTGVPWRLPNVKELASLLEHEHRTHIDTEAFPGGEDDMLWTSSSFPTDPTPRCVDFIGGHTFACSQGLLIDGAASRLVRDQ